MKMRILIILIILFLFFIGCATHKKATGTLPDFQDDDGYKWHLQKANTLLKQKAYPKAKEHIQEAIAINPNGEVAFNLLGMVYFLQNNLEMAEEEFRKAIEINPGYAQPYSNLGNIYFMRKDFEKAQVLYEKALSFYPDLISANYSLGALLLNQGLSEEGVKYITRGILLAPDFLEEHKFFTVSFSSSHFKSPEILFAYAKAYAETGDIENVVKYLEKAKDAGFQKWYLIEQAKEFEKVRQDQRVKKYLTDRSE